MAGMRVVHEPERELGTDEPTQRVLATDVEVAETALQQGKGLMFRTDLPEEYALVLEVGDDKLFPIPRGPPRHVVHMLFVRLPLDVIWLVDDEVTKVSRMHPWRSIATGKANRILELPAGNAADVEPGDVVRVDGLAETAAESGASTDTETDTDTGSSTDSETESPTVSDTGAPTDDGTDIHANTETTSRADVDDTQEDV